MTTPVSTRVPVLPVVAAGVGAQLADDLLFVFLPAFPGAAAILAIGLTAVAARMVTGRLQGSAVPRAGLALGAVSALLGLWISGLGLVAILVAGITVVAGVGGAVLGRPDVRPGH
ncbi:hypothetical protein [Pseudonocardia pini]|uniref:hypothetical protein n=1 Tax=Pseudonocardia pini TaxID=2758030 RepID=UPI0015F01C37|nr:hypothetical protein [Pseudonocardia pini]